MLIFTCDGNGNGSHPVSGTSNGTEVIPSHLQRKQKYLIKDKTETEREKRTFRQMANRPSEPIETRARKCIHSNPCRYELNNK